MQSCNNLLFFLSCELIKACMTLALSDGSEMAVNVFAYNFREMSTQDKRL